jgi:hypothetical protein
VQKLKSACSPSRIDGSHRPEGLYLVKSSLRGNPSFLDLIGLGTKGNSRENQPTLLLLPLVRSEEKDPLFWHKKRISSPMYFGGWGLKKIHLFCTSIGCKDCLGDHHQLKTMGTHYKRKIFSFGLHHRLGQTTHKQPQIMDQVIWKAMVKAFPFIENWIIWKVRDGAKHISFFVGDYKVFSITQLIMKLGG